MTSIGFRAPGAFVPPAVPSAPERTREVARVRPRAVAPTSDTWARVGRVDLRSARHYLAVWALVLFVVLLAVQVLAYVVLGAFGVLGSVSRALALVSDEAPSSGLVPVLQPQHVLPLLLVSSLLVSGLLYVASLGALMVHNATTSLTGGLRFRVRPERSPRPRP